MTQPTEPEYQLTRSQPKDNNLHWWTSRIPFFEGCVPESALFYDKRMAEEKPECGSWYLLSCDDCDYLRTADGALVLNEKGRAVFHHVWVRLKQSVYDKLRPECAGGIAGFELWPGIETHGEKYPMLSVSAVHPSRMWVCQLVTTIKPNS